MRASRRAGIIVAAAAVALWAAGVPVSAQKDKNQKPDPAAQAQAQAQAQEVQALVRIADTAMAGQPAPSDFPIEFKNDFIKAQAGRVWVPMTLTIDPSKLTNPAGESATLYLRVAPRGMTAPPPPAAPLSDKDSKDKKKKDKDVPKGAQPAAGGPSYPFEDVSFGFEMKPSASGQPVRVLRGVGVPPGAYDLYVVIKERATPPAVAKTAVLKQPLDVPNFGEFATSSILLASEVKQLPTPLTADQQTEHPYTFGQTEIVISPEHTFKKSQELVVLMQIYNPMISPEKKFSIDATYTFFKQGAGGETRFNSTEPQSFSPETMGPGFDPSNANMSIQAGQGIPLQSFPEGNYRLEIKITDKLSSRVLTQSTTFTVTP